MGYHILLHCRARIKPKYVSVMDPRFFWDDAEDERGDRANVTHNTVM
jgi:hypothetical protein